jgi:hypothetical protein
VLKWAKYFRVLKPDQGESFRFPTKEVMSELRFGNGKSRKEEK